jgi:hypothetical protein
MKFTTTVVRYRLLSPLSPRVIATELNAQICGPKDFRHERMKRYSGVADDTSFAIRKLTKAKGNQMQKSFNFIKGTINPNGAGSSIEITVDVPLLIFGVFVLFMMFSVARTLFNNAGEFTYVNLLPFLMIPVTFLIFYLVFIAEIKKTKAFLLELFKAEEVSQL